MSQVAEVKKQLTIVLEKLQGQAARITGAIAALDEIEAEEFSPIAKKNKIITPSTKRGPKSKAKARVDGQANSKVADGAKLPSTGGNFWPSLINTTPQTQEQILDAAIAKIGDPVNKVLLKKLNDRLASTLHRMVNKTKEIDVEGSGKMRTFVKKSDILAE